MCIYLLFRKIWEALRNWPIFVTFVNMDKITNRPDPNVAFPNPKIPSLCYIKNVVKNPRIIIGDYTYYDDVDGADQFENHVTHFYNFIGDKLIIGKFCAIARGISSVLSEYIPVPQPRSSSLYSFF